MSVQNLNDIEDMRPRLRSTLIDLSAEHLTTFDMGWLIPQDYNHLLPGDKVNLGHTAFFRFDPFINPILSRCNAKFYDFLVPERILYNEREYEKWFTGGVDGQSDDLEKPYLTLGRLYKLFVYYNSTTSTVSTVSSCFGFNTPLDYLGFPISQFYVPASSDGESTTSGSFLSPETFDSDEKILIEPLLAYGLIYREYFMWNHDADDIWVTNPYLSDFSKWPMGCLDDYVTTGNADYDEDMVNALSTIFSIKHKGWNHDYFTSALPNIQSGDPATLGGNGDGFSGTLTFTSAALNGFELNGGTEGIRFYANQLFGTDSNYLVANATSSQNSTLYSHFDNQSDAPTQLTKIDGAWVDTAGAHNGGSLNGVNIPSLGGFTINDLRLLNAIQVDKERSNLGGNRLKEALYMKYGVTVPDDRLDRPDFVGYMDFPVQISEVLQTSQTTDSSELGDYAGHGIGANSTQTVHNYFVLEPMIHMSIMCIIPDTYYYQGLSPFWSKTSKYDVWNPVFNHLSDQAVYNKEIFFQPNAELVNNNEFGYLPRFAEYKCRYNRVSGFLTKEDSGMMSWHQARTFANTPVLGQKFINAKPTERIFSVVDNDKESSNIQEDDYVQTHTHCTGVIDNHVKVQRNIPSGSDPSLNID